MLDKSRGNNKELFNYIDKNDYYAIGMLKIETKFVRSMGLIKKKNNLNVFETIKEQNKIFVNNIELNDEFDREEISSVINSTSNLVIKADIAGAGKTSAFTYTVEKSTTLLITPYNALCFELRKKDTYIT
jgi:hypothetical protein